MHESKEGVGRNALSPLFPLANLFLVPSIEALESPRVSLPRHRAGKRRAKKKKNKTGLKWRII